MNPTTEQASMTTFNRSPGNVLASQAAKLVVRAGIKMPWKSRAATKTLKSWVKDETSPPIATHIPPTIMIGWIGNRSERKPKKRFDRTMPSITADTVKETCTGVSLNSCCSTGRIGWVR